MSKLYNAYTQLKKQDSKTIYLFKSGIFFIALNEDAHLLSNLFELKLGKLNDSVVKAGFPCSSYDKYENMFKSRNLNVQIVNVEEQKYTKFKEYTKNKNRNFMFPPLPVCTGRIAQKNGNSKLF